MQPNTSKTSKRAVSSGKFSHLAFCFLPLSLFVLFAAGIYGRGFLLLLPAFFLVGVLPLLDLLTGWQDNAEFEIDDFNRGELFLLRWNPRLYALLYMGSIIYVVVNIGQFSLAERFMLVVSSSLLGGIGFGAAHELLHAKEKIDQFLQRICTAFLFYPHYKLIHIRSHHVHTSTDYDENTAWYNETIYSYIARTIPGSAVRCWQMEARQLAKGKGPVAAVFKNKMTWYAVGQLVPLAAMYLLGGLWGFLFYVAHLFGSHVVLESVNYIQHYGLMRDKNDNEYEKTGPEHSWDTYHFFSSYVTYRVGHHSSHHLAVKPYYLLVSEPDAPKLPSGYFWAIAMIYLPPWWRRVINPKLKAAGVEIKPA
jgi:alkane 1-monooxygenase